MLINLLRAALDAKQLFQFDYDDKSRLVEPHAIGLNAKGEVVMRGYQVDGDRPGWRMFILEKARTITVRGDIESQAPRPGYKAGDKGMTEIFGELPEPQSAQVAA